MSIRGGLTVFMHIPKTGGTTLHNVLSRKYSDKDWLHVKTIDAPIRFIAIEKAKSEKPFLIKGHLGYKEVKDIPGSFLFTFLRPPISRVISHYYFLKETPSVKHYEFLNRSDTTIESFYAQKEKRDIDNCLVRYISGNHKDFGTINEEDYLLAIDNLEHKIDFFGLQEHYDESLIMLGEKLGWTLPVYRKTNLTKKKEIVSPQTLEFLKEANKWDILLFEKAKEIFRKKMEAMTAVERRKLARLRVFNKIASAIPF
ncbi:MAG: sulfotransferase family 2 domain-containing protein [Bacteroidota bacterium]|nr:sulfotransferase family 2 domain-containing protein [Bacteroidota bacterium]